MYRKYKTLYEKGKCKQKLLKYSTMVVEYVTKEFVEKARKHLRKGKQEFFFLQPHTVNSEVWSWSK